MRKAANASRSVMPVDSRSPRPSKAPDTTSQMCATFWTSRGDLTIRRERTTSVASTKEVGANEDRRASRSASGIRTCVSWPIGRPIRPDGSTRRPATSSRVSASSPRPSSSGRGAGHVRTSSIQVAAIEEAPIAGITAMGLPSTGSTTNHGRVGLCQNGVWKPVR